MRHVSYETLFVSIARAAWNLLFAMFLVVWILASCLYLLPVDPNITYWDGALWLTTTAILQWCCIRGARTLGKALDIEAASRPHPESKE